DAGRAAELVDHDRQMRALAPHLAQQRLHRLRIRYEQAGPHDRAQVRDALRLRAPYVTREHYADDPVDRLLVDGIARMALLEDERGRLRNRALRGDPDHGCAWRHDL